MNSADLSQPDLLVLLGHTAGGKTSLAAHLALRLGGEVISADSRQVYRGMDIGTGKDLSDYRIGDTNIMCHLIDLVDAGEKYSLYDFQRDFRRVYREMRNREKFPVLCGGTGLYIESILKGYDLIEAPVDMDFRKSVENSSMEDLVFLLENYGPLHNQSDTTSRDRLIRALEIARAKIAPKATGEVVPKINPVVFGISYEPEIRRQRITSRLTQRLETGMIDEVRSLLLSIRPEDLVYYGLEYKYLTLFCLGKITYAEMFSQLNTAIHQFAKRQMTWFRGMERRGIAINWIPGELSLEDKIDLVMEKLGNSNI